MQLKLDSSALLGNSSRICFWEGCWCGEGALSQAFPTLYSLADQKGVRITDVWDNGRGLLTLLLSSLNDWEIEEVQCFQNNKILKPDEKDKLSWRKDKKGLYAIRASVAHSKNNQRRTTLE